MFVESRGSLYSKPGNRGQIISPDAGSEQVKSAEMEKYHWPLPNYDNENPQSW